MIRLLLILMLFLAGQAQGTIAIVTGNIGYTSATVTVTTSGAITISPSMTTGQYLVVAIATGASPTVTATNLERIGEYAYFGATSTIYMFGLYRATGTVSSYTINNSSTAGLTAEAAVFSATNRLRFDISSAATAASASVAIGNGNAASNANELVVAGVSLRGIASATFSSAQIQSVAADNTYQVSTAIGTAASERAVALWYRIITSTTNALATVTASASGTYAGAIVCIEETPSAAAGEVSYGFSQ